MSTTELIPLFPSATHPAIPIAARILSTLRNLTAPGKGNDMKPEERAALVGISALLGCEKIQSKDLPESSAQKASSVSPAHFRSALSRSRRLLSQTDNASSSPSRRSSPRRQQQDAFSESTGAGPSVDPLSPFQTPRKKFKYSSGIDVSDLLRSGSRSAHTPSQSSPLRHSTTPAGQAKEKETEKEKESGVERTPTKRTKFHPKGVDLAAVDVEPEPTSKRTRKRDDLSAFLALRPGSGPPGEAQVDKEDGDEMPQEERDYLLSQRTRRNTKKAVGRDARDKLTKRDWTCRETVWGSEASRKQDRQVIDQIMARLPSWLEQNGRPPLTDTGDPSAIVQAVSA